MRNRKQKPGETVEDYIAAIEELWKRIDSNANRVELDRIHEFIEGLRPEFVVPVQSSMPTTVAEAIEKARAVETAFSIGMELSAYSMISGYLKSRGGMTVPAKVNLAMYQPSYMASNGPSHDETMEQIVERKIKEGITAALGQFRNTDSNNESNSNIECYNCKRKGHIAKNCRQRGNSYNRNTQNDIECFNCRKKGHIARNCKSQRNGNNSGYRGRNHKGSGNNQALN